MKIRTSHGAGFTLVEIMIVVAIIGMLAAIAIPNFVHARQTAQQNACIANLRQLDGAVQQYALENKLQNDAVYTLDALKPYVKLDSNQQLPTCPAGGQYNPGATVADSPTCSVTTHHL